jgi:hypothetical protein
MLNYIMIFLFDSKIPKVCMTIDGYSMFGLTPIPQFVIVSTRAPVNNVDLSSPNGAPYYIDQEWFQSGTFNFWKYAGNGIWVILTAGSNPGVGSLTGDDGTLVLPDVNGNINLRGLVVANSTHSKAVFTESPAPNGETIDIQVGAAIASTNIAKVGLLAASSAQFSVDANGFMTLLGGTGPALQGLSDDVDSFVSPAGSPEKIQLVGHVVEQGATKFSTVVAGTNLLNINPMSSARWIVDRLGFNGTHTTITSAIASATFGDTIEILPGTYPEDPPLKAGVNIVAQLGDSLIPNVIINGKCTYSGVGITSISNICLQTNNDYFLEVSGSSASVVRLNRCRLVTLSNVGVSGGINFSTSSSSALIRLNSCTESGASGLPFMTQTSPSSFLVEYSVISGGFSTPCTLSAGNFNIQHSFFGYPISASGTGGVSSVFSEYSTGNTIALTLNGGASNIFQCKISSGSAAAISTGTGTVATNCTINSTAVNVFTGAGSIDTGGNVCLVSSGNNVATINNLTTI